MNESGVAVPSVGLQSHLNSYYDLVGSDINFAFQTIIDAAEHEVTGFEALVRGIRKEPAPVVISRIPHDQRFAFDQACRIRAIEAASDFDVDADLHLNCTDIKANNVALVVEVIQYIARRHKIEFDRIVLELNNLGSIGGREQLQAVQKAIHNAGFQTLADNFGRRNSDLLPIALFKPQLLKLDHHLVENIHKNLESQAITRGVLALCQDLNIIVIAGGVEKAEEFRWLQDAGVELFQGYFFAQPGMDDS
jgi:EAL domain-containing protein (putative c-di-GMP-specific phosphodiesterase class I)